MAGVVIIGAGQAGLQTAIELRAQGYGDDVTLVGEEGVLPYHRPPLSKAYLTGDKGAESLLMRGEAFFTEGRIALELGTAASGVDRAGGRVILADGRALAYGHLVFATGAAPRRLACPGHDLDGVVVLRSRADSDDLRARLDKAGAVVVVGGGFIGLEVAASARKLGKSVTVLEAAPRLMGRAVGEGISGFFRDVHRAHGVDLRLGASLAAIEGDASRVSGVRLQDGEVIPCEVVVVGIGVTPNVGLAAAAGLEVANGIVVDRVQRTSDPSILALGDCAAFPNPHGEGLIRLESVQAAVDQAKTVAAGILGRAEPYSAVPWFWSDQYDLKLQMVGLSAGHDRTFELGDRAQNRFSVFYLRNGAVIAIDSVNRPADHMRGRKLLAGPDRIGEADIERLFAAPARS